MRLLQIKTQGMGLLIKTGWLELCAGLNLFVFDNFNRGLRFLEALETINPPEGVSSDPFADFPKTYPWQGLERPLIAAKKTAVMGIFAAEPKLTLELGRINPALYEADRLEVGRRVDHSRWYNFVEIASSTKAAEIAASFERLSAEEARARTLAIGLQKEVLRLDPATRIKDELADSLAGKLAELAREEPFLQEEIAALMTKINRAKDFTRARKHLANRLPLFTLLSLKNAKDEIEDAIATAITTSQQRYQSPPIFLLAASSADLMKKGSGGLVRTISELGSSYQCLLVSDTKAILPASLAGKCYLQHQIDPSL